MINGDFTVMYEIQREQCVTDLEDYDHPDWIDDDLTGADIEEIQRGGCESGAYMPAVTYYSAVKTMSNHGDKVLEFIEQYGYDNCLEVPSGTSWGGIAVHFLSMAVELWASLFEIVEDSSDEEE